MPELEWVFAYGSNMHLADLRRWLREHGHATDGILAFVRAILPAHELVWNYYSNGRKGGAANIAAAPGARLPGIALRLDARTRAAIDQKEGCPTVYKRQTTAVDLEDGTTVQASVYVAHPDRCTAAPQWPTRAYRDLIVHAAIDHGLPAEHIAALQRVTVRD